MTLSSMRSASISSGGGGVWGGPGGLPGFSDWPLSASSGSASAVGSPAEPIGAHLLAPAALPDGSDAPTGSSEPDAEFDLEGSSSIDLHDFLTAALLDEVAGPGPAASSGAASSAGEAAGGAGGKPRQRRGLASQAPRRRTHDPDATDFLFHLVTSVHEDHFEAARGDAGAGYRRQIAAEAVEAIEKLGADVRGCDAETEDGAPLTLLTLLFRNNDWGGNRSKVVSAAIRHGADPHAPGIIAVGGAAYSGYRGRRGPPQDSNGVRSRILVTPLHLAALQLDVASAAALLAAGADPNAQARVWVGRDSPTGGRAIGTPLHFLASAAPEDDARRRPRQRHELRHPPDVVQWRVAATTELLLQYGADLAAGTDKGSPPIEIACGGSAALPWGCRRSPAAVYVLRAAARGGAEAVRELRLKMARRVLAQQEAEAAVAAAAGGADAPAL